MTKSIISSTAARGDSDASTSAPEQDVTLGQWYWYRDVAQYDDVKQGLKQGDEYEWLGCVIALGSNYVEIQSPKCGNASRVVRVHFTEFWTALRREYEPDEVIARKVDQWRRRSGELMAQVQTLTAGLGVASPRQIQYSGDAGKAGEVSTALATLSGQQDIAQYQHALVVAKEQTLPQLFEDIRDANENLANWMTASTLAIEAQLKPLKQSVEAISDRIFSVSLYAGLAEQVVRCCEGRSAPVDAPLHVMQRRLYMDEECLLNYTAGGMEFGDIVEFDQWLCQPENRDRILPFPRTLVAMRVRRDAKERQTNGSMLSEFVKIQAEDADKSTLLYIRNGEQVWRLSTQIEFGEMIFPDRSKYQPGEPMMIKMAFGRIEKMITRSEYDSLVEQHKEQLAHAKVWREQNPGKSEFNNPHLHSCIGEVTKIPGFGAFDPYEWETFDRSNVRFDDANADIEREIKEYNRIAVIIQGLFDRSEVLLPHPPVQTWRPESFARSIRLIFDASLALDNGRKPDFEAYRAACNASLGPDSIVTGQRDHWLRREAQKLNRNRDGWDMGHRTHFTPAGNPGPGLVERVTEWKPRARSVVFRWCKEAGAYTASPGTREASMTVDAALLFNISAYTAGDYRQFFADPRTRAEYLQWAPILLTAEDYLAGKVQCRA